MGLSETLPMRDGVGASRVRLPAGHWALLLDFLCHRFPAIGREEWVARIHKGLVLLEDGSSVQGFVCESHAVAQAEDITALGGWRAHLARVA
jgi:hypothetical protein